MRNRRGKPRLVKEQSVAREFDDISELKGNVACPGHFLKCLLKQTNLDESTLHLRYLKFRKVNPSGFMSLPTLKSQCIDVMDDAKKVPWVNLAFEILARDKQGWGTKMIGFREVLLMSESLHHLHQAQHFFHWVFRMHDTNAAGEIPISMFGPILEQLIDLMSNEPISKSSLTESATNVLSTMVEFPYRTNLITEDEFVYDMLHNRRVGTLLRHFVKARVK
eukprot:TCALIF_03855-PA protein Name:"Protein of unknown function" AED:0.10 eAED:0.19 QI:0/0/0/0.5/1/1/2/0/220